MGAGVDWLLVSCIASFLVACGVGFLLIACWISGRAIDATHDDETNWVITTVSAPIDQFLCNAARPDRVTSDDEHSHDETNSGGAQPYHGA